MTPSTLMPRDLPLWEEARGFLDVRSNDVHTLISYGIAKALLVEHPGVVESIVLPAILLHDVGWKRIDPALMADAIGPNPTRKELVKYTAVVLGFVVVMMAIVYGLDVLFAWTTQVVFGVPDGA